jgi:nucleoside-diphosphate-sugar epimerase
VLKLPSEYVTKLRPFFQGKRFCVTGGAGFIGGHLVDALFGLGASVCVIDDLSTSSAQNLAELIDLDPERVRFVHGSILDDAALADAMEGASAVFHLAAMASVPRSVAEPERNFVVNGLGTLRVAEVARQVGAARIIYSASSSAYGDPQGAGPTDAKSELLVPSPLSPYAAAKLSGEHLMRAWSSSYGISTLSLRYFNIFGPRQAADSPYSGVIAIFCKKLLAGETPTIYGDGQQSRDFTYVTNAVLANLLAAASPHPLAGEVFNIGAGRSITLLELFRMIAERCGMPHASPAHAQARAGDVRHSLADVSAAQRVLGYAPIAPLDAGLDATVEWYRSAYAESKDE